MMYFLMCNKKNLTQTNHTNKLKQHNTATPKAEEEELKQQQPQSRQRGPRAALQPWALITWEHSAVPGYTNHPPAESAERDR